MHAVKSMNAILVAGLCLVWVFGIFQADLAGQTDQNPNQCVQCHANLKKLIRLCWEVEKTKPKPKTSAETSGEG